MKRLVILSACLAISLAGWAQDNRNDSLRMDSIIPFPPRCDGKRQPTYRKGERGDIDL